MDAPSETSRLRKRTSRWVFWASAVCREPRKGTELVCMLKSPHLRVILSRSVTADYSAPAGRPTLSPPGLTFCDPLTWDRTDIWSILPRHPLDTQGEAVTAVTSVKAAALPRTTLWAWHLLWEPGHLIDIIFPFDYQLGYFSNISSSNGAITLAVLVTLIAIANAVFYLPPKCLMINMDSKLPSRQYGSRLEE